MARRLRVSARCGRARREWRSLGIALAVTMAIAAVSLVLDGDLWRQWLDQQLLVSLRDPIDQAQIAIPLIVRLPLAAVIVAWGGLTNRRWTVPVAAALALPVLWFSAFSILAAIPAIYRPELQPDAAPGTSTVRTSVAT
ncbi:MAG: hypothetical protein HY263_03360 [Chloroflexi bacterium]|nr:hypothetical protein [Chloroflexota bacterium]